MINPAYLKNFYENESMRETVKSFMVDVLKEIAVQKTFDGEETTGIKDARELVDKTFDKLKELYGKIDTPNPISPR